MPAAQSNQTPRSTPPRGAGQVTLVMATFRRTHCLAETARQLLDAQTRPPLELIIVNNDPAPGAEAAVRAALPADPRIVVTSAVHGRQGAARNHGLELARGDYVAFVDDDDDYAPEYIAQLAGALDLGLTIVRCRIQTCGMASPDCTGQATLAHHPLTPNTMARRDALTATWNDPPSEDRDYWTRHPVEGAIDDCLVFTCRGPGQHSPRNKAQGGSWRERFVLTTRVCDDDQKQLPAFLSALREQRYANFVVVVQDHTTQDKTRRLLTKAAQDDSRILLRAAASGTSENANAIAALVSGSFTDISLGADDVIVPLLVHERLAHPGALSRLAHVFGEHPDVWATYGACLTEPRTPAWPQASFPPALWAQRGFRALPALIGEFAPLAVRAPLLRQLVQELPADVWHLPAHAEGQTDPHGEEAQLQLLLFALEASGAKHAYPLADALVIKNLDAPVYRTPALREARVAREFAIRAAAPAPVIETLNTVPPAGIASAVNASVVVASAAIAPAVNSSTVPPIAPVLWAGPFYDPSGYGSEARGFVQALDRRGTSPVLRRVGNSSERFRAALDPALRDRFDVMLAQPDPSTSISVLHLPPSFLERVVGAEYMIARTMFETDGLPAAMVARCNQMDELWLPSAFNEQTFRKAGVRTHIQRIPGAIDSTRFSPDHAPYVVPGARGTVYLSTIEWKPRKGWQTLVQAWADAFTAQDDVCLVFRSSVPGNADRDHAPAINREIDAFLATIGRQRADIAPILVIGHPLSDADIPRLYTAASAYVVASSGEGWGYPYMEAMASGLPTIATRWSANLEFMHDENSLLCDVDTLIPAVDSYVGDLAGQRWAKPSTRHLTELLRVVVDDRARANAIGARAREDMVTQWTWDRVGSLVQERLEELSKRPSLAAAVVAPSPVSVPPVSGPVVRWEGPFFTHSSLGVVNREIGSALLTEGRVTLVPRPTYRHDFVPDVSAPGTPHIALAARMGIQAPTPAAVHVGHQWPPVFHAPAEGAWVLMQPWEYGGLPGEWIPIIRDQADEMWVYCSWQRECAIESGVPADKVSIVPLGVDVSRYTPDGVRYPLRTRKRTKLLAVGGIIPRKGMDVLVQTYLRTFTKDDDVCLVIKGLSSRWAYHGNQGQKDFAELPALVEATGGPEIEFIGDTLDDDAVASLYRACDVFVAPFRGEGFGLPIAEAMASGLPVVVTNVGPMLDLCDEHSAYLLPYTPAVVPPHVVGVEPGRMEFSWAEPDVTVLAERMRHVVANPEEARAIGARARERMVSQFQYSVGARAARARLLALSKRAPVRFAASHVFTPAGPSYPLDQPRGTVLLFQPNWHDGDWRDVVRTCFLAFTADDDVSLVLTLDPAQGVSSEQVAEQLATLRTELGVADEQAMDVLLVPDEITEEFVASLFRSADHVLIAPRDVASHARAAAMQVPVVSHLALSGLRAIALQPHTADVSAG
ncbi:MAG: glycosyltransferase [Gemmatimonadaceae bacterium]|nr:glycosyltransferase [Gemmatimonadaceae bacterium]